MSASSTDRSEFLAIIAQTLFRSRATPLLAALGITALTLVLTVLLWGTHQFFARCLGIYILIFGSRFAWELLPFPEPTRARWARQRILAKRYFSYRCRKAVWVGAALLIYVLWAASTGRNVEPQDFIVPGLFLAWGGLSHWYWNRVHAPKVEQFPS